MASTGLFLIKTALIVVVLFVAMTDETAHSNVF